MNPDLLAVNQDIKGEPARLLSKTKGIWLYQKNMSDGSVVVALLNPSKKTKQFDLKSSALGLEGTYSAEDIWQHNKAGTLKDKIQLTLKGHETVVLKLKKE